MEISTAKDSGENKEGHYDHCDSAFVKFKLQVCAKWADQCVKLCFCSFLLLRQTLYKALLVNYKEGRKCFI